MTAKKETKSYRVVRPWTGVEKDQIIKTDNLNPSLKYAVVEINEKAGNAAVDTDGDKVQDAQKTAAAIIKKAETEVAEFVADAKQVLADAQKEAAEILSKTQEESDKILQDARTEAEKLVEAAKNAPPPPPAPKASK